MFPGFKAKNHPAQQQSRSRRIEQVPLFGEEWQSFAEMDGELDAVDDRETPDDLFQEYHQRFAFTVDAAAAPHNAKLPRFWTRKENGLAQPWAGERVWCNPPFSRLYPWAQKAHEETEAEVVCMLVPANRTEQPWWQEFVEPYRDVSSFDRRQLGGRSQVLEGRALETEFKDRRRVFSVAGSPIKNSTSSNPPFGIVMLLWVRVPF